MFLEALASVLLGLALALLAGHRLGHRLPARNLVLATGAAGALFGAFVTHSALGPGHALPVLGGAVVVAVALLSLLVRPAGRGNSARSGRSVHAH
ncbi:hypothetical protein G6045_25880 [Streptomyces sp. YC504]|uniref:Integral membrane protein n=1 Tax=Streptomyces mesophilus TaxID=1775132 RepID=A0A6G4XNQ0_9ACTN|nr:hypothetical protein [Streptomyces mesophilus]NGO79058.1 hypothetical protein [Streptomyces mesophilus]